MNTGELLKYVDIPRHKLYYLEQKGYIHPKKTIIGDREYRDYSSEEVEKVKVLWKYLKAGFKYKVAYQKAIEELNKADVSVRAQSLNPTEDSEEGTKT